MFARGDAALYKSSKKERSVLVPVLVLEVLRFRRRRVSYSWAHHKPTLKVVPVASLQLPRRTCDTRWTLGDDVWVRMERSEDTGAHFASGVVLKERNRLYVVELGGGRLIEAAAWQISSQTPAGAAPRLYQHSFEQLCIAGYPEIEAFLKSTVLENSRCFHWSTREIMEGAASVGLSDDDSKLARKFCDAFFSDDSVIYMTYHEAMGNGLAVLHDGVQWWVLRDVIVAFVYHVEDHVHLSMKSDFDEFSWAADSSGNMIYLGFIARLINNSHEPSGYFMHGNQTFTFMTFAPVADRGEELSVLYNEDGQFCSLNGFKCCCKYCLTTTPLVFEELDFPSTDESGGAILEESCKVLIIEDLNYHSSVDSKGEGEMPTKDIIVEELGFPEETLDSI